MDGQITGLDLNEAMITARAYLAGAAVFDHDLVDALASIENGALEGIAEQKPSSDRG